MKYLCSQVIAKGAFIAFRQRRMEINLLILKFLPDSNVLGLGNCPSPGAGKGQREIIFSSE
jgi:hypothetical protein